MLAADAPPHHAHAAANRVEYAIVRLMNNRRAAAGLPRLRVNRTLANAASAHSRDMASHGMLSHDASDGTPFAQRLRRVTRARMVGETIAAMSGAVSARKVVRMWLQSPPHRAEILTSSYRLVGVGVAHRGPAAVATADFASAR